MSKKTRDEKDRKGVSSKTEAGLRPEVPPQRTDETQTSFVRLLFFAILPALLGLLLAFLSMKGCEQHREELVTPDPARVWEEGIKQEKEHSGGDPKVPEWIQPQEQQQ